MDELWHPDPHRRLAAARAFHASEQMKALVDEWVASAPQHHWPFGMPTSINAYLLFLGPSPGGSPSATDRTIKPQEPYPLPTSGHAHPGLSYADTANFWSRVREAAAATLAELHGMSPKDALGLTGLLNLSEESSGKASQVNHHPEFCAWVMDTIRTRMKPRLLIPLGLQTRKKELMEHFSCTNPTEFPFNFGDKQWGTFIAANGSLGDNAPVTLAFFPNHLSRYPFTRQDARCAAPAALASIFCNLNH